MPGLTEKILRANVYGQIVEYHQVIQKRSANHIANAMSADMLQSKMNQELTERGVDGWCDGVVVVQHALTDDIFFYGYMAATEPASPQLVIPMWALVTFILATAAVVTFGMWLIYSFFTAVLEKAIPTDRYTTEEGETTTSFTEYVTLQRQNYWLVCPKCGMGFADKNTYPTWEQIPPEIHTAFEEHVAACTGIPKGEAYPWLVPAAIGGVVIIVVGLAWVGSQVLISRRAP